MRLRLRVSVSAETSCARAHTQEYILQRYDAILHLVTAADGAEAHYKRGRVLDDSGQAVFRKESPHEAVSLDRKLQQCWDGHPCHVVVRNEASGFEGKLRVATDTVLAIARRLHPQEPLSRSDMT